MTDYDVSSFTEEQKKDWMFYGVIPGPVHNNFDVCDKSCYVATLEHIWRNTKKKEVVDLVDIYVITNKDGYQSVLHRKDSEWEGSYGSMPLESFIECIKVSELHCHIFNVLINRGRLKWEKTK